MAEKKANGNKKKDLLQYGSVIFGVGLLITVVSSFFNFGITANKIIITTLVLFGIIIGVLNIRNDESNSFLIASIVIVLLGGPFLGLIGQYILIGKTEILGKFFSYAIALIVPSAIVVSFKILFLTARDE